MSTTTRTKPLERGRVGETVRRHDAVPKVTGEFAYASDLQGAGMLWGHTLRSPHAHARIVAIDRVRYFGEPVALVAAEHPEQARRAAEAIRVEYEPLPVVADMELSLIHI